ncbi:helix-turn-helix domain-containing protein [Raineyella fluvialis]|uniref:Helix-turn-helix domain-containing protein n=1 Tax=Raineyella fluvialis TaxID=2662261 RepID=A0A5Q2FG83_9ACTN|nr:AraC family transcriptional regulator [Raineyella fluvialis]QGF23695.1 helix-turn-helix domain-containing protein [Raineyella fluvialis]
MTVESDDACGRRVVDAPFLLPLERRSLLTLTPSRGALVVSCTADELRDTMERMSGRRITGSLPPRSGDDAAITLLQAPELVAGTIREVCRAAGSRHPGDVITPSTTLLEQHLLGTLSLGLAPLVPELRAIRSPGGPHYLHTARDHIERHLAEPLTVGDVAAACGVSERQLQAAFSEHLSTTPLQFIRERRLARARRLLTDPAPAAQATVASIAAQVGVMHLGRFAKAYAERYGESPSTTLAAARGDGPRASR